MALLGGLIALGAALIFILVGALTLFGAVDATRRQVIPGFLPDRPPAGSRLATFAGIWVPVVLLVALCLLAGIQILRVAIAMMT